MGTLQEWPVFVWLCTYISTYLEYQYVSFSRNVLGTKNLGDILSERESIANMMQSTLDEATDPWGVKVERVEVWVTYFFWCFCDLVPDLTKVVVGFKIGASNNRNAFTKFAILEIRANFTFRFGISASMISISASYKFKRLKRYNGNSTQNPSRC